VSDLHDSRAFCTVMARIKELIFDGRRKKIAKEEEKSYKRALFPLRGKHQKHPSDQGFLLLGMLGTNEGAL